MSAKETVQAQASNAVDHLGGAVEWTREKANQATQRIQETAKRSPREVVESGKKRVGDLYTMGQERAREIYQRPVGETFNRAANATKTAGTQIKDGLMKDKRSMAVGTAGAAGCFYLMKKGLDDIRGKTPEGERHLIKGACKMIAGAGVGILTALHLRKKGGAQIG